MICMLALYFNDPSWIPADYLCKCFSKKNENKTKSGRGWPPKKVLKLPNLSNQVGRYMRCNLPFGLSRS